MPTDDITGRDGYIIDQALATTYALIGSLPDRCQEASNMHDMAKLLRARLGEGWKFSAHNVRSVLSENEWLHGKKPLPGDPFPEVEEGG